MPKYRVEINRAYPNIPEVIFLGSVEVEAENKEEAKTKMFEILKFDFFKLEE